MNVEIVQCPKGVPFYTSRQTFDGRLYRLTLEWNQRSGWYLGLADSEGVVLFSPRKLVADLDLLVACRSKAGCPPGALLALDTTGGGVDPGYEDLASGTSWGSLTARVALVYVPESSL